jgi:hypothetical protein
MKIEFKGILKTVFPAELIGEKKAKKVTISVHKPARTDEFGETVGYPDDFELSVYNDKINEDTLKSMIDQKVEIMGYLNSFEWTDKNNGNKVRHGLTLNLAKIDVIQNKKTEA